MNTNFLQNAWDQVAHMDWEQASYVVTVLGFPAALLAFMLERRKARIAETEEIDADLLHDYQTIVRSFIEHPELDSHQEPLETLQQTQQQKRIYELITSIFEKAFIQLYGDRSKEARRMWNSWEDYIYEWLGKPNFRAVLPELMRGEDPDFIKYMQGKLAQSEQKGPGLPKTLDLSKPAPSS